MLDVIEKLVKLKTTENNIKEINQAINLCINYFNEVKDKIFTHTINNSILISNHNGFNFDVVSTCHIDVVPMQNNIYNIKKENNIIYGRGVFDMKSFVVSALFNLKKLIQNNINTKYAVLIVSNEETAKESDTKLFTDKITTQIILDSDSGNGNINSIVKNNLGAITIKLSQQDFQTTSLIKNNFSKYYCDFISDEVDILFDNKNILIELQKCMKNNTTFEVLMFNEYIENDINNKYSILYKNIAENKLNTKINYITSKTTTDSRFFSFKNINVINHQATGGNYHKIDEWIDYKSLLKFNKIQWEFLKMFNG